MAEISALTPSPPGMCDHSLPPAPSSPHALPSIPPSESPKQALLPKSTLYGDRYTMGTPSAPTASTAPPTPPTPPPRAPMLAATAPLTPPAPPPRAPMSAATTALNIPEAAPPSIPTEITVAQPAEGAVPPSEGTCGPESMEQVQTGSVAAPSEAPGVADPGQEPQQKEPAHSPDLNPSPNLYPSVHINPMCPNPTPVEVLPPWKPPAQTPPQAAAPSTPPTAPAPPASSSFSFSSPPEDSDSTQTQTTTASAPSAVTEAAQAAPATLSQAQPPQPPPRDAKPQAAATTTSNPHPTPGPKPVSPTTPGAAQRALEPPGTPSRTDPPILVVQESGPMLPLPTAPSRPAPDTLSYLESASMMSGTLESLSGLGEDGSSIGSDSEVNGLGLRRTDKYGFLGGAQYFEGSEKELKVEVARQREMKWLDMFNNWDKWVNRRFQKVKLRCRKGIPSSLRAKAWQLLSDSKELLDSNPGKFEELEREPGDPKWLDIIEKDLHRQFPFHEMFAARGGHGQQDLYRILKAYTVYRPEEGYCQAQAPVAAVLLMHMPAEQAFWCLVQICEKFLPGYYSAGLEAIQLDGEIFFSLLRRVCPMAYRHLKKFKIDPILYMTEWFMCIFSRTLPWSCVLRVWDMFFCEGVKVVFRVGLVLLKQMLGSVDKLRELQGMYETMERLRNIPPEAIREEWLIQEVITLPVTEALIERECKIQVRKWRESRGELTHQPSRRLHGTRDIFDQKRRASAISSGGSFSFLGSSVPPPGPLRASSSLLSLPGFRRSKAPFHSQPKKGSLSGPSGMEAMPQHDFSAGSSPSHSAVPYSGGRPRGPSPLVGVSPPAQSPQASASSAASDNRKLATLPPSGQNQHTPSHTLAPSPKVVAEHVTPTIPSPTANNAPLPPCPDPATKPGAAAAAAGGGRGGGGGGGGAVAAASGGEEEGKKKKRNKEEKKREKEEEKQKAREKKEKDKADKERQKKDRDRAEKDRKKTGKKKDKGAGGGEAEEKNGDLA